MKKTLLSFAMLLSVVGAWAEDIFVTPEAGKFYYIKGTSTNVPYLANQNHTETSNCLGTSKNEEGAGVYMLMATDEANKYYVVCVNSNPDKKYMSYNSDVCLSATQAKVYIESTGDNDNKYYISVNGNYMHNNKGEGHGIGTGTKDVTTYNKWGFVETSYELKGKGKVYTIEGGNSGEHRGFLAAGVGYDYPVLSNIAWASYSAKSTEAIEGGKYWYIQKLGNEDTYILYNLGKKKFIARGTGNNIIFTDYPYAWKISLNTSSPEHKVITDEYKDKAILSFACGYSAQEKNVRANTGNNQLGDGGSKHTFTEVGNEVLFNFNKAIDEVASNTAKLAKITLPVTYKLTDTAGGEHSYVHSGDGELYLKFNGVDNYTIENEVWDENGYSANIDFGIIVSSENTVNPLVIAIDRDAKKSFVAQKIPGSSERYVRVTEYSEDPELGYGQWAIYPTLTGNKFGFKIKNIATETYIYANSANTEYPVTLNNDGTTFDFVIGNDSLLAYNDGADTRYLSVPTNDDYGCHVGVSPINEGRKAIIFPEFKRYTVNIGATGYTTLHTPFTVMAEVELGKKLEVYTIIEDIQPVDTLVHLTQMDTWNSIPANSACILRLTEVDEDGKEVKLTSGRVTCVKADNDMVRADWSGNLLKGSYTNSYVEGKAYVLSAPDGPESVGMYWATLNKDANGAAGSTHFKNNSGKAYILAPKDADSNVRFLAFNFGGEETGIIETENENLKMENAEVYDLAGRRVQGAQKGIFIVNGKLVIK